MDKRISIKTIYLLLVISIGLIGLGIGSTYTVFTARAEIDSPIVINSNLTHDSEVLETIEIEVPAKEVITSTLNISNTSGSNLNYSIWFIDEGEVVFLDAVSSTGTLTNGGSTSVNLNILNKEDRDVTVNIGISSSPDSIVLGSDMKKIDEEKAYAVYSEDDNSLSFYRTSDIISIGNTYNNKTVTNVYTGFETSTYENNTQIQWSSIRENITSVHVYDDTYALSTAYWFRELRNCSSMDLTKLYTANVSDMRQIFYYTGYNVSDFEIIGLNNWDTSNVTTMISLFCYAGYSAIEWTVGDLSNWDTSNVTTMKYLFDLAGYSATKWTVGDLSNWNTSKVTDMEAMFYSAGYNATEWNIGNLKNWDTSNVETMGQMFNKAGGFSKKFVLDLTSWNTSKVTDMEAMFHSAGYNATEWTIGDLSNWNTSKVTNMHGMFLVSGYMSTNWTIGDLSNWDVSSVTNMDSLFGYVGYNNTNLFEIDLSGWDTSNVIDMSNMFSNAKNIKTIYVSDKWNTNAVTSSESMFIGCTILVGELGTTYNSSYVDKTYARIDGGTSSPGYLTLKSSS